MPERFEFTDPDGDTLVLRTGNVGGDDYLVLRVTEFDGRTGRTVGADMQPGKVLEMIRWLIDTFGHPPVPPTLAERMTALLPGTIIRLLDSGHGFKYPLIRTARPVGAIFHDSSGYYTADFVAASGVVDFEIIWAPTPKGADGE